ncbi:Retrovirus-related Pol polyprotein from transposon RE2 [Vitis vinifera]|uniref:Retrovirus-related Pol polyprotein from transposon RE2 n=1 Tax=Vitis vinifera TaxID=29760 RepID=A0A438JIZ4_VITVI|nr:Retrovirus-related Pol polyprotein from transposon RE2 [Vitis vinifera]
MATKASIFSSVISGSPMITSEKLVGSENYLSWSASVELWFMGQGYEDHLVTQEADIPEAKGLYMNDIQRLYKVASTIVHISQQDLDLSTYIGQIASLREEFLTVMPLTPNVGAQQTQLDKFSFVLLSSSIIPHSLLFLDQPLYFLPPRVFGCTCFVHILTPGQDKLSAKAMKCLFLGYSRLQKGYRCYSLETHRYFISADVTFFEDSPFSSTTSESLPVSEVLTIPIVSPPDAMPPRPLQVYHRRPRVVAPLPFAEAPADSLPIPSASPAPTLPSLNDLPIAVRKGTRSTRNPHPIYNFLSYHRLSSPYSAFVSAISSVSLPKSTHEALSHPGWQQTMVDEMAALHSNDTWDLVVLPSGKSTVGCRWVYVVKIASVRLLLSMAAMCSWPLYQLDIKNAFLHGDLAEEVYMEQPPGFVAQGESGLVCRLRRSLYGLKQSPRAWFGRFSYVVQEFGMLRSSDQDGIQKLKQHLFTHFQTKDLGKLKYFLGIEIAQSSSGVVLSQRKYALDILEETGMLDCKPVDTPMDPNVKLVPGQGEPLGDPGRYRRLVGKLNYLTITRPDISFPVSVVSQFLQSPCDSHWDAVIRILRYIKSTPGQGVLYENRGHTQVVGYTDVDWAGSPTDRRSTSGYCVFIGGNLISWKSKKQDVVARSNAEAEYRAMALATCELIWLRHLLRELRFGKDEQMKLICNNQAALHIASNPVFHERTKHIEVDCHFIREKIESGCVATSFVNSNDQLADIFTKSLRGPRIKYICNKLGAYDVCQASEIAVTSMETEKQEIDIHAIPDIHEIAVKESSAQDFEDSIKECVEVEKVAVELDTEAQHHGSEASDTKTNSDPTEENKNSVDPGEKLEGAPESVAEDQSNETLLELNQTQIKENNNNVQDQKSESVEEQNIEQGLQEDEKDTYEETESRSDARDHINEIQNANETTSEKTVDISHTISEESEEINKEIIQEAETCYNKLNPASEKVETEETGSWEAQLDEKPLKGSETSSEEKTLQTTAETSPQGEEGESMKLEETTELMSQFPAVAGENADKESGIVEKSHVDEVEETKGDSETVSESREQCVEDTDETQKSLTVEESEGIIKEEIKGPSESVSGCNHQGVEAVIEDEINVMQTAAAGKSEKQHQETSKTLLSEEQDHGITAIIGYSEDEKAKEGEISGLVLELNENIQQINPIEPPKEECITLDEVSQLEHQENASAIKCSDSPTESDKVMELSEEVPEEAEKAAEERENIKERIIEREREIKEFPAVSIEDESVDKEQHSETVSNENPSATDSEVQTEKVNLEVEEDFSKDPEGSPVTKAMEEEMLQKQGSEEKVDVSSSVSEISEEIKEEIIEDADTCSNNIDTASEKVETEQTSLQEAQLDDKHIKIIETSSEDKTLQTNTATETSPQGVEVDRVKLEETSEGVSQLPAIACENRNKESEIVEKPHVDEVEEIEGASETVSESREQCVEENDGTQKSLTVEESEERIIKEEIKGPSETVSGCNYEGVEAVIEDEIDVVQTATEGKSEEQHQETSKALLSEEQDHGIIATIGYSEDGKTKEEETPKNENLEDSFATKTADYMHLQKEEPRELELSGLGLELNENIQQINPNKPPKEECITLDEVSQLEHRENVSAIKCSYSPTESDKVMELSEEVPEGAEKTAEESENIKERIIEREREIDEFPAVSIEDESVDKEQHSETVSNDNPSTTDSEVQTEKGNLEVEEDFSKDPEGSPVTKAMEEEMLQKQGSEKKVEVSSSVSEISEEIKEEVIEDADTCSNNIDTASEKVETEQTSLQEAQLDDKHIKIIETSSEDKTLQTNTATETSPQGVEVDRVKLEETSEGVSQLPAIACENRNKESEIVEKPHVDEVEEIEGASETVSESREQCVEENDGTQKSLTVEESEHIIKEEIKGPSETVSGCNYEGVEAVIEDEIDVVQTATEGKSEEQNQETSKALLSEEQDHGIIATIGYSEDGKTKEDETPQNENLEDSFATKTADYMHLQKEEPRELELSGLGLELNENIQQINPNKPPKEECITLDEVSQLEHRENVSAIKCSYSPTESDKVMELSEEVPEEAEKAAEERENIKERIIEREREINEFPAVSIEDESVDKEQHSETVSNENPSATDSEVQTEKVNLEVEEDFSKDPEGSPITKAMEEEMLQKQGSEEKVDVSSSVSEISEKIEEEAWLDDKHMKIIETSSEDKTLQTNPTTETSPQGEEVDSIKLEETSEGVSQLPAIACENTDESETVEKPHADEVEEVKGPSDTVYECKEQFVGEIDETQKSLIVEESEECIIKEEIKGPSETVPGCNYEGVEAVIKDEINVVQAATAGKSEESNQETSTALFSEEQDHGITAAIGYSEDGIAKEDEIPQNEDIEDSFATKTEEEVCLQKEEPRELEISGLGLEVNENMQKINPNEQPKEECITVDEVSQLEPQENVSAIKCSDSPTESDKAMELSEEVPEGAEKAEEERENIKELIIEKERDIKEFPAVSIEDESVNKEQHSETVSDENPRATDSEVQTENVNLEVVEDFSKDPEGSPITKAMEEEMLQKQGGEKKVDVSSSVSEISEEINKEVIEDADTCSNSIDTASEKVETEQTSLQEAQLDDKHIKIIETSSEDKTLQTNTATETSPQGVEVDRVKLEETSEGVSQLPAIACENRNKESEIVEKPHVDEVEEIEGASETVSESREQCVEENDGTQKSLTVEESEHIIKEEIKGPSETVSGCNYEGVEAVIEDEIDVVQTATEGKSEEQNQETSKALLSEERDHGIIATIGYSEDGKTKEEETPQNENLEDSFATKTADYMHLQKEEPRELELSGLGLELNENIQKNNPNEPPKEECSTIDEVSPLEPQENVSVIKCTDSPVESDKVMELTEEVPEGAEKAAERENIKELIIEKERDIKELPAVSTDELVIEVQVLEPVSSENLGVTDPNMPAENLNLEVEDSSKEPKRSPITEALEEEMSEKQDGEKAMDVLSSVSEMQEENIKEEIMEKADISYSKLDAASEKGETEESSSQEAQLDDEPVKIIETSSEDKTLQTNTITETSPQAEEVDRMKLEETLELVSQLPAKACENTNKESETVERPIADEIEETTGASDTVSESKEQCAEEIDETQKSLSQEKSEEDIIKEQIKGASEMDSESKYQGVEAVIEEEITAGQAIQAEKPEEQLEEVSTAILSEKLEDENIKEGEIPQYKNPQDSFGTKTSENTCLQKEEPRELDVSGLGLDINNNVSKEDGNGVDGVSQYELQENASELKYTDSLLESEKVMEQTRSINSAQQEATKDDENLDSGIFNNNPDVLTHSPGEEILQEVDENCEEASNLECENFEKASEPVLDLQSTEIDEAVVGLEVGAHIQGSDAPNTKNSDNLIEEVPQGAEKAVESENIKEPIIEKERDIKELPAVYIEDETVNKVQHAEAVSNENLRAIDSNMQTERLNSEVAEYLSKDPEGSPISQALQEEMSQKQASEKTVEITISVSEMSEESFKDEIIKEADTCSKLDTAPEKVVTEETSLQEVQLDDKPLKGIETSTAEKILPTNTTTESSLQGEEVDSLKVETSELKSRLPTIACESADKESKTVEKPHADEVEEPKGPTDTVSESREQCVENIVETRESLTLQKSEENIIKEEIKGPSDTVSECTYQSFEAVIEDEITADQTIEAENPEEQLQEMSTALVSEEQEHGISTITTKLDYENTVEDETPQYENQEDSLGTKMTEERCLDKEESRELEVSEFELNDDVQKKPSNEEPKEGGNFLHGITPSEPQEEAFEIKCRDSLAESDMELTRSMDSISQEASKDDEDLDSGISIKNVDDVLPPHSSGEEILQKVDENCEEASNLVHSAEVDKAEIELEAGSHSHGSEASSTENNNNLTEKNIELADLGEKVGGGPDLVAEDQCNETLPETNQTQVNENSSSAWEQNTKSIEEQIIGQGFQEREKETIEETESKLESRDHINVIQNENETTKDVISVEEVPGGAEKAEEKENIQELMIEEKRDIKELPAVSIEDETVNKVQHSEPVSCESFRARESNQETKEVNLEDEEDTCEKTEDVSSSVFGLSEQGVKGEIIDEADNYNKLDTASEKVEAEKTIWQEPQLDDEPLKGIETILEEKTPPIINTTESSPGDEEVEAVKLEKTSDLVSQLPTTAYEHADKESVIVEKAQADEVEETKRASDPVSESKDHCVEEIDETQRSLTMEKLEEDIIEEEITGRSSTVSACNQGVEAIIQDEISRESLKTGNSEEQLQEMSTARLSEEKEHDITTTIGKSEAENKSENETPQKECLEDSIGTKSVEEICLQMEGLRELEVSALAPKLSNVIQKESPNEVLKEEGEPQENVSEIKYMDSITASEEVMKLTRSIDSSSQEASKEEEILDSGNSNNKADDFSITHSSVEILQQLQEQFHYPEVFIKLEEPEVKEEHLKTSVTETRAEEIPHEKTVEANEIIKNEISNEEIAEEKQVAEDYQPWSLDEETIRKSQQEDELKNEVEHEELYGESQEGETNENIEKQIIDEARTVEHPHLVSFGDESLKDNLPEEAKGERNDEVTDIKLDLANQSDETALSEQVDCSDIQLVRKDLDIADTNEDKEIVITKDEDLKPNLDVLPATSAAAEEASLQKEGDRIGEVSESVPQEPVHETTTRNEEIATAITDNSENVMEDKMHTHTPLQLACNKPDVSEGLNLKDPEVDTNENGTSPLSEMSWEEIPDKEGVISEEERQHDLTFGKQTIAESMPTEEKGAKDEVKHAKDEEEHTKDEVSIITIILGNSTNMESPRIKLDTSSGAQEPREFSARGSEGKLEEAEMHSTKCNKDGEIQDQIEKLNASSQVQYSCMEISEKEVSMDLAEANESTQDIKQLEKGSDETSEKHIPREAEPNESTEVMISSSKEDVQLVPQDLLRKTFQQPEVESLEAVNVSGIESGLREKDSRGEKTMGDISKEPAADSTPMGPAVSLSDLLQRSVKETLQAPGCLTEEKEPMANQEDVLAKEEQAIKVQEAGTHEDRDEEEEGDEHKKDDSGSDAPIIVEASRDMNVKDGHKKSHNILSGVGSKVKHSIAKVKKAITGKSSHQKHSSPKGTATKVKEQK